MVSTFNWVVGAGVNLTTLKTGLVCSLTWKSKAVGQNFQTFFTMGRGPVYDGRTLRRPSVGCSTSKVDFVSWFVVSELGSRFRS